MSDRPMTQPQRELIDELRRKAKISPAVFDDFCESTFECAFSRISVSQASWLITTFKTAPETIAREIRLLAGQQPLFEVPS